MIEASISFIFPLFIYCSSSFRFKDSMLESVCRQAVLFAKHTSGSFCFLRYTSYLRKI
jgi:hypothetical protein